MYSHCQHFNGPALLPSCLHAYSSPPPGFASRPHHAAGQQPHSNSSTSAPAQQQQQDGSTFSWTKHWWPVTPLSYLDPKKPVPVTLLGHTYVLWFDQKAEQGQGKWRVMEDRCPHRWVGFMLR
jgi:hypothetical protein